MKTGATMRAALFAAVWAAAAAAGDGWDVLPCPSAATPNCSYTNTGGADQAVNVFLQAELAAGEAAAGVRCSAAGVALCHRAWGAADTGSAGDCFFILPAGETMQCVTHGGVSYIATHGSALKGRVLAPAASVRALPEPFTTPYRNTAAADAWVSLSFDASGRARNDAECEVTTATTRTVACSYAVNGPAGAGSCNFPVPAGATLTCRVAKGSFTASGTTRPFARNVLAPEAPAVAFGCPNVTYPAPNLCDCEYTNRRDVDLAVAVVSESVDGNYNAFHCYIGGTNICAWGSNANNNGNRGGCSFVLPAGETFACAMQWGAASFKAVTARALATSLWPAPGAAQRPRPRPLVEPPLDAARPAAAQRVLFAEWKAVHNKTYPSAAEEARRFDNFRRHLAVRRGGDKAVANRLADWTVHEFEAHLRGCALPTPPGALPQPPAERVITPADIAAMPAAVDWRGTAVTEVKDQGQCGSCWSFSSTGAVEGAWAAAGHGLQSLSEQELVSCDTADGNAGCGGGWPYKAIDYLAKEGAIPEAAYPYVSGGGDAPRCAAAGKPQAAARVVKYYAVNQTEDAMAAAVAKYGPVSVSLDAMTQLWWPYTGGVMTGCCNTAADHAVLVTGYGVTSEGTKYWWIKNSWGKGWGEGGYVRLERGTNQCGITTAPVQAMVATGPPTPPTPPTPPRPCPPSAAAAVHGGARLRTTHAGCASPRGMC